MVKCMMRWAIDDLFEGMVGNHIRVVNLSTATTRAYIEDRDASFSVDESLNTLRERKETLTKIVQKLMTTKSPR